MIIGICGKSGSGKSTLASQIVNLTNKQIVHLEIDKIGHSILLIDEVRNELIKSFGESIIKNNKADRKKLGEIIFNSRIEMKTLSNITWKYMQIEIDKFLENNKDNIIILDWLLLPISKYFDMCDIKILLDIPYEVRKQRVIKRDNIPEKYFELREKSSIDFNENDFDYVLKENDKEIVKRLAKLL